MDQKQIQKKSSFAPPVQRKIGNWSPSLANQPQTQASPTEAAGGSIPNLTNKSSIQMFRDSIPKDREIAKQRFFSGTQNRIPGLAQMPIQAKCAIRQQEEASLQTKRTHLADSSTGSEIVQAKSHDAAQHVSSGDDSIVNNQTSGVGDTDEIDQIIKSKSVSLEIPIQNPHNKQVAQATNQTFGVNFQPFRASLKSKNKVFIRIKATAFPSNPDYVLAETSDPFLYQGFNDIIPHPYYTFPCGIGTPGDILLGPGQSYNFNLGNRAVCIYEPGIKNNFLFTYQARISHGINPVHNSGPFRPMPSYRFTIT